jgi:hypothetical protein
MNSSPLTTWDASKFKRPRVRLLFPEYGVLIKILEEIDENEDLDLRLSEEEGRILKKLKVIYSNIERNGRRNHSWGQGGEGEGHE